MATVKAKTKTCQRSGEFGDGEDSKLFRLEFEISTNSFECIFIELIGIIEDDCVHSELRQPS